MVAMKTACAIIMVGFGSVAAEYDWGTTVDVAGRQRMLSQKMSKEFFLVAAGLNPVENKAKMLGSIDLFDVSLNRLIAGDEEAGIYGSPTDRVANGLQVVVDLWTPFKALLVDNIDSVRSNVTGAEVVDAAILEQVAEKNIPLLKTSNAVVGLLVDSAAANGAATAGLVVDIAGRQRMLIQRLAKVALLVFHQVGTEASLQSLKNDIVLFGDSHKGIIEGAEWAGVPLLTKMCTLQQMREVTYQWDLFLPFLDRISAASTPERAVALAKENMAEISLGADALMAEMVAAVKLYVDDPGDCQPVETITGDEWIYLINNIGKQRFLGQQASALFLFIANDVQATDSKLALIVAMADTSSHLQTLVQGSRAKNIPAPPTQELADELLKAYEVWTELHMIFEDTIQKDEISEGIVRQISHMSNHLLTEMDFATKMYVERASASPHGVPAVLIDVAGRQRMFFQKMSKEAALVAYGSEVENNLARLKDTMKLFEEVHWMILRGNRTSSDVPRNTDLCVTQQLKRVADIYYGELAPALLEVANGTSAKIEELIRLNPIAFAAMNTAVGWFAEGSATCDLHNVTDSEWKGSLIELTRFRARVYKALFSFIAMNAGQGDQVTLEASMRELGRSMRSLHFGDGSKAVPAPFTQEILDQWWSISDGPFADLDTALGDSTRYSAADVVDRSSKLMREAERLSSDYTSAAERGIEGKVDLMRMELASNQIYLAHKIVAEAFGEWFGVPSATVDGPAAKSVNKFDLAHDALLNGGLGVEAIIDQRPDLLEHWDKLDRAWLSLKKLVSETRGEARLVMAALDELEKELVIAAPLFSIPDPYISPEPPAFPWTLFIFLAMGFVLCSFCMVVAFELLCSEASCYKRCRRSCTPRNRLLRSS